MTSPSKCRWFCETMCTTHAMMLKPRQRHAQLTLEKTSHHLLCVFYPPNAMQVIDRGK